MCLLCLCRLICTGILLFLLLCVFFFKQKTAYEMRISDWSSDVCSSDLPESYKARPQQWFAMIYLTDTTRENGCLRVIPGSHRHDHPLHHLEAAHSAELQGFLNPDNPAFAAHPDEVAVPVTAGDVLVGDARLIHSAYGNATVHERPLLTL